MGNIDLLRPLATTGAACAMVRPANDPLRHSRMVRRVLDEPEDWDDPAGFLERLEEYGRAQPDKPVLFYQYDENLLFVSRNRERLSRTFRFVVPDETLVEDLLDKARFERLARELDLPVPPTTVLFPREGSEPPEHLDYPLIVKPLRRCQALWGSVETLAKAVRVDTVADMRRLWPRLVGAGNDLLAQTLVPGPETRVESYHAYVDEQGRTVAEFTGRKVRTWPREYGFTTALVVTEDSDVLDTGRAALKALGLRGVGKADFKRGPDGRLWLLEVNPRFNLWHHPGALAGVNIPALVYARLTGADPVAPVGIRRPVSWCTVADVRSATDQGMPMHRWFLWALRCETKSEWSFRDPKPFMAILARQIRRTHASHAWTRRSPSTDHPALLNDAVRRHR
jgi:D-aspartate ligase